MLDGKVAKLQRPQGEPKKVANVLARKTLMDALGVKGHHNQPPDLDGFCKKVAKESGTPMVQGLMLAAGGEKGKVVDMVRWLYDEVIDGRLRKP